MLVCTLYEGDYKSIYCKSVLYALARTMYMPTTGLIVAVDCYRIIMHTFRKINPRAADNETAMFALIYYVNSGTTSTSHYGKTGSRTDGKNNTSALRRDGLVPSLSE